MIEASTQTRPDGGTAMSGIHEQKCPNCGAALRFDPAAGLLICDYCDTRLEVQKPASEEESTDASALSGQAEELSGFDFKKLSDSVKDPEAEGLPVYACISCGADLIAPAEQSALTCPYCGNNIVLTEKVSGPLRPDGVIPFQIASQDLSPAVRRFYKGKKLLPRGFFSESSIGPVTGVYAPFWLFTGRLYGELTFNGETRRTRRSGDYLITDINRYKLDRDASIVFDSLPVDAGTKIDDSLMDSLEPFRTEEARPFDLRYLAGFTADRFDEKKDAVSRRAVHRMNNTAMSRITSEAGDGFFGVSHDSGRLNADIDAKYLLFPVYLFDIQYGRKNYPFAVNGQTGKVVGQLPTGKAASFLYFFKRFGIVSGALILATVLLYFLGV